MHELVPDRSLQAQLRPVRVEETLGTERVVVDRTASAWMRGRSMLIIGAGGELGRELAHRAALARASSVVMVDRDLSALDGIAHELIYARGYGRVHPMLFDGGDSPRLIKTILQHEVDTVLYTAGHAPAATTNDGLVELVANNVLKARKAAHVAAERGVERFLYVSNLKAAEKTTTFDLVQRLGEQLIRSLAHEHPRTHYTCVRLGDVFRGPGGLISRFERELALGGPVVVPAGPRVRRLLTTARAAELFLHAGRLGGTWVYATSAGVDVEMETVAKQMILLSGREPIPGGNLLMGGSGGGQDGPPPSPAGETAPHPELVIVDRGEPIEPDVAQAVVDALRVSVKRGDPVKLQEDVRRLALGLEQGRLPNRYERPPRHREATTTPVVQPGLGQEDRAPAEVA